MASTSEPFMIGATTADLRKIYSEEVTDLSDPSLIAFKTSIKGVNCMMVYTIRNDVVIYAVCLVKSEKLSFRESIKDFFTLLSCVLNDGMTTNMSVRLNGSREPETKDPIKRPPNYIRVVGSWKKGFDFSATLDGDETMDFTKAGVNVFSIAVRPEVKPLWD